MMRPLLLSIVLASNPSPGIPSASKHLASLYHSLDPFSIVQNLSFYTQKQKKEKEL